MSGGASGEQEAALSPIPVNLETIPTGSYNQTAPFLLTEQEPSNSNQNHQFHPTPSSSNQHHQFLPTPSSTGSFSLNGVDSIPASLSRVSQPPAPVLMSEDYIAGSLSSSGRMSPVRRFFCLLVTFDVLFTCLLWVITVIVTGNEVETALYHQVLEYSVRSSMFDCVLLAAFRFIILIVCYALFDMLNCWPIAITTALSSAFLVAKVFLYEWAKFGSLTFDVTLILLSFILAWGETWFLDFRVIPLETKALEILKIHERTPLLSSTTAGMLQRYTEARGGGTGGSISNFYTPLITPEESGDDESAESLDGDVLADKSMLHSRHEYRSLAKDILHMSCQTAQSVGGWKTEITWDNDDKVESKIVGGKRVFRLTANLLISARILLDELFYGIESSPKWNSVVAECKIVETFNSNTDIVHQVCSDSAGGTISARDFVILRHWELVDGAYVLASASVNYSKLPLVKGCVRAEHGPSCFILQQSKDETNFCTLHWLLDIDLKIWLPKSILHGEIMKSQHAFMNKLRKRMEQVKAGFVQ